MTPALTDIRRHCYMLSLLFLELPILEGCPEHHQTGRSRFSWEPARNWLEVAAGIEQVEVDTSRFDSSVLMCKGAFKYQSKRSELLSELTTQLTVFNMIWSGLEAVGRVVDPRVVPSHLKKRPNHIDNLLFYLKEHFEPRPSLGSYDQTVRLLKAKMSEHPDHSQSIPAFKLPSHVGVAGAGAHVVRVIRNNFAHGDILLPDPEEWETQDLVKNERLHGEVIQVSSRIILLTTQMLLLMYFRDRHFKIDCMIDQWDEREEDCVQIVLQRLHLEDPYPLDD